MCVRRGFHFCPSVSVGEAGVGETGPGSCFKALKLTPVKRFMPATKAAEASLKGVMVRHCIQ